MEAKNWHIILGSCFQTARSVLTRPALSCSSRNKKLKLESDDWTIWSCATIHTLGKPASTMTAPTTATTVNRNSLPLNFNFTAISYSAGLLDLSIPTPTSQSNPTNQCSGSHIHSPQNLVPAFFPSPSAKVTTLQLNRSTTLDMHDIHVKLKIPLWLDVTVNFAKLHHIKLVGRRNATSC